MADECDVSEMCVGRRVFGFIVANWRAFRTMGTSCVAGSQCTLTGLLGSM